MFGAKKVLEWRFETWNEPDLRTYNKLNFTLEGLYMRKCIATRIKILIIHERK